MIINYSHRHRPLGISKRMRFDYFDGVDFLSTRAARLKSMQNFKKETFTHYNYQ